MLLFTSILILSSLIYYLALLLSTVQHILVPESFCYVWLMNNSDPINPQENKTKKKYSHCYQLLLVCHIHHSRECFGLFFTGMRLIISKNVSFVKRRSQAILFTASCARIFFIRIQNLLKKFKNLNFLKK